MMIYYTNKHSFVNYTISKSKEALYYKHFKIISFIIKQLKI